MLVLSFRVGPLPALALLFKLGPILGILLGDTPLERKVLSSPRSGLEGKRRSKFSFGMAGRGRAELEEMDILPGRQWVVAYLDLACGFVAGDPDLVVADWASSGIGGEVW